MLGAVALWHAHVALDWARVVLGAWAAISPWLLASGFTFGLVAIHVVLGLVALAFPAWRIWSDHGGGTALTA